MTEGEKEIALEQRKAEAERLYSPSAARNKDPIAQVFGRTMPKEGLILEIASGTGEHGAHLCAAFPSLRWQPSDPDPASRASQAGWAQTVPDGRMRQPLALDVTEPGWWEALSEPPSGMVCINMIHIAPPAAMEGLFTGAGALLAPGQRLFLYGPFSRRGAMAPGNQSFDASLKSRDPSWGVRDLDDQVQPLAARFALHLQEVAEMPANNLSVVFEKG
jgi:hypothetical protein